jgi:DNA-binding MarR family transcriptional regulator
LGPHDSDFATATRTRQAPPVQLNEDLLRLTRIFVAIAAGSLEGEASDLSIQQYRALAVLASQEDRRPVDLARALGVTASTTTTLCDRLVRKGLISRRHDGNDRRTIFLSVTAKGRAKLTKVTSARSERLREIYVRLPPTVQTELAEVIPAIVEVANALGIDEWSIQGL